ncbi:MAG: esterase, partial [Rhizobium altiplani]
MVKRSILLLLFFLTSCGHPDGVMTPVPLSASAPPTSKVAMLVATTREPS